MALHRLEINDFYDDYYLIAVHSSLEDYRIAYMLNHTLNLNLVRKSKDLDFKNSENNYSWFEWYDTTKQVNWNLVSNSCKTEDNVAPSLNTLFSNHQTITKTFSLIPEYKKVDYFIKISDEIQHINQNIVLNKLKSVSQIVTSYALDPKQLKSKAHLIF